MANSNPKSIGSRLFGASNRCESDWTRTREWIILILGTALVAFIALALSQYRPLIRAVERLPVFEFIVRLTSPL